MAPRRAAPVVPVVEEEEQEQEEDLIPLQFDEPLSWRAGKPIAVAELIRRLKRLAAELATLDQETADKSSLTGVAKELVAHNLLGHKDNGVKAFVACCLVDILKICAPHAPFTHPQTKDVFNLFVNTILPALGDPTDAYNTQHKYVLVSLAEVQSIVLLDDVDNNEGLLLNLFTNIFDAVSAPKASGERIAKDVEHYMGEILEMLISEGANLPSKVVDVIMAQFYRAAAPGAGRDRTSAAELDGSQSTLLLKEAPEAYQMAKAVCNACSDKMARLVAQYFSDVIMDFSGVGGRSNGQKADDSDDDEILAPSDADLTELRKAHLLLRELWRAAPLLLANVIPQLDAELSADNVHLRQLATETLGDMISGIGAAGPPPAPTIDPAAYPPLMLADEVPAQVSTNILRKPSSPHSFAQTHPAAYHNFVNRKNDKSSLIRAAWTTAVGYILSTSAGGIGLSREEEEVLVKGLAEKLNDGDEKVRLAAVRAIESFGFKDVITKLAPNGGITKEGSVLGALGDRCRDRRQHVRIEAMALLGKLWAASTGELAAGNEVVIAALGAVPSRIYNVFYANDLESNVLMDKVVNEYLVPLSFPPLKKTAQATNGSSQTQGSGPGVFDQDAVRAERIMLLVRSLDAQAKRAFFANQNRQPQYFKVTDAYIKQCLRYNGGVMDGNEDSITAHLEKTIQYLTQFFPDPARVRSDLHKFAKLNDRRCYQLIRFITSLESDFKTVQRAMKEFIKRLQGNNASVLETMVPLLYRSGCILLNRSHLSTILEYSRSGQDDWAATAHEMLNEISQRNPDLFKTHIGELCKDLVTQAPSADKANDASVVETLRACSSYAQKYPQEVPRERDFVKTLTAYALYGQPAEAAKHAVNIMLAKKDDKSLVSATELLQKAMVDFKVDSPRFPNKLITVSQLVLLAPEVMTDIESDILGVVSDTFKNVRIDAKDSDPGWAADADLDEECQVKMLSIKFLVKRIRGMTDPADIKSNATTLLRLLIKFVVRNGEMCKTKDTPRHHKSRLRLMAAQSILKVCMQKHCDELLTPAEFNDLALVSQDEHPQVRRGFIEKLQKHLVQGKLRTRFYTILFLAAFEPLADFRQRIETWIRSRVRHFQNLKQNVMESVIARLISLLAHHPDYSTEPDDLVSHARYIVFYVSNVASEANLGLIYKYAERVKQTLDPIDGDKSENLYVMSDLAQAVIRKWQEKRNWSFQAYPSKVGLPVGLYAVLPSHDAAQEIAEKQYIPDGIDDMLDDLLKDADKKKKRKSIDDRHDVQSAPKRQKAMPKPVKAKEPKPPAAKKAAKPKTPARPKKPAAPSSSSATSARRRSGRSATKTTYMERDSDQDDEEMLTGVAEWDYESGAEAAEDDAPEQSDEDKMEVEKEEEPEEAHDDEDENDGPEEDSEEEEAVPAPKTNGRRGRAAAAPAVPAVAKPAAKAKPKTKAKPAASKAKAPAKATPAKTAAKSTRGKGAKRAAKDVYDMDEDD